MSDPKIGVLLPVRLETVLDRPDGPGTDWILRVLVVPDEASIDRFDDAVDAAELDDLEAMWAACGGSLDSASGAAAFRGMAARHGAERTAWLARRFPAGFDRATATLRDAPRVSTVRGFPRQMEIWIQRGGPPPVLARTLDVNHALLSLDVTTLAVEDPNDPDGGAKLVDRWWNSWDVAENDARLGASIVLGPSDPADVELILVVGLGDEAPNGLFTAHRDAGRLAILEPGTPTNTVGGVPAADLAHDVETWRAVALASPNDLGSRQIGQAITGDQSALGPLPGGTVDVQRLNSSMVRALWPVLWGRALKDVWDLGDDDVIRAGEWAGDNLFPEGPLPPIRIGDQPYGLLPVTMLDNWVPGANDSPIEEQIRTSLIAARDLWAAAAGSTIVGANTIQALNLLGQRATSAGYSWRWFLPLELLHILDGASGASFAERVAWWDETAGVLASLLPPTRRYATLDDLTDLGIPLVTPTIQPYAKLPLGELIEGVAAAARDQPIALLDPAVLFAAIASRYGPIDERVEQPDSLLLRLLVHAALLFADEVARRIDGESGPLLEPVAVNTSVAPVPELARWLQRYASFTPAFLESFADIPQAQLLERALRAIVRLSRYEAPALERVFRATLDAAAYRIDLWITGIAWHRLMRLQGQGASAALGVYGWVDGPLLGQRGPTDRGLVHAPSDAQVRTAIMLRDRAAQDPSGRWDIEIDSAKARLAHGIGEAVRQGSHLHEALGRAVERAIRRPAAITALRNAFPLRKSYQASGHAARRVCDGYNVLRAIPPDPTQPVDLTLAAVGLTPAEIDALRPLREIIETYGDVLLADAAYHMMAGNAERAGATMRAAAGLTTPPELEALRTPRGGRAATTTVVTVLPVPAIPLTGPAALADPAVAGYLQQHLDPATNPALWTWHVQTTAGQTTVGLDDLGLTVADSLALTSDDLARLAIGRAGGTALVGDAPGGRDQAERLARLLGSRPAVPRDVLPSDPEGGDTTVRQELLTRLAWLLEAARTLSRTLRAGFGEELQADLLRETARWGIAPVPKTGDTHRTRLRTARTILEARIRAVPPLQDVPAMSADRIARAIADLASPGGRLPVLSRLSRAEIGALTSVDPALLGRQWLEIVAAVRSRLAPLEAHQLGTTPLAAWTNRPGDPWQTVVPPTPPNTPPPSTQLLVAYGPDGVLAGGTPADLLAVGLLDSWTETIPHADHTSVAAFGFNAPSSRPPQAILLAVTPDESKPLDTSTLVGTLLEARQLLRARMATPSTLDAFAAALPSNVLAWNQPGGVRLEP